MSEAPPPGSGAEPVPTHLYDEVASQRDKVVSGFAEQREVLARAVREQRLAAMPEHLRAAALSRSERTSAEIVAALQQFVSREVTRQLELAIKAMIANTTPKESEVHTKNTS
ncbi:hypothetical protein [Phenylobacterium sp.]|uniref:hypothetical protein n=1 Tax=Phenylobacterium sp. TaxID=1871053 RepID=UPI003568A669